jgi:hypothetical protein
MIVISAIFLLLALGADSTVTPTLSPTRSPTSSPTVTDTNTQSTSPTPTNTVTLSKTYQPITFVNPNTLVLNILQKVQIVCAYNCSRNDSVYLTSTGFCGQPSFVPLGNSSISNSSLLNEVSSQNFTATFDTSNLIPGVYILCWRINFTSVWINTGMPVTVVDFQSVSPSVIQQSRDQTLSLNSNPGGVSVFLSQIFLSSIGCPPQRDVVYGAREETSPVADETSGKYVVAAQGLRTTSKTDDFYSVCYRQNDYHGWTDTLLKVQVVPTSIVKLLTPSVAKGLNQQIQYVCTDCSINDFVFLSSAPCTATSTPVVSQTTSSFRPSFIADSTFVSEVDTTNLAFGTFSLCLRKFGSSAQDTGFSLFVRGSPVYDVNPKVVGKLRNQVVKLECSTGCSDGDLVFLAQGTCEFAITAGPSGSDSAYLSSQSATINAEGLNPDTYKLCFKAISGAYLDTGLTITVTGSRIVKIEPLTISRASDQTLSLTCTDAASCVAGDFAYLTTLACSTDSTDPIVATSATTLRQALTSSRQVSFDASTLNSGSYRLCYRKEDGIYADAFIPISIRDTPVQSVTPSNLPKSTDNLVTFLCNGGCLDDSTVYLTTSICSTTAAAGQFVSSPSNITSNKALLNTAGLVSGFRYRICFKNRGLTSFIDTGLNIAIRATPVIAVSPRALTRFSNQRLTLECVDGCADGDFVYITSALCGTTTTDPVPSSTTSTRATLARSAAFIDASALQPLSGYKLCYRPLLGSWADTNLTVILRTGFLASITPQTVVQAQLQQLTFSCGVNCSSDSFVYLTKGLCSENPSSNINSTGPIRITNNVVTFDASSLTLGYYTVCFSNSGSTWSNSTLWVRVTRTAVYDATPSAIKKALGQALVLSCNTGCADGDYIYLSKDDCITGTSDPSGTATTTVKFKIVSKTASVDALGL